MIELMLRCTLAAPGASSSPGARKAARLGPFRLARRAARRHRGDPAIGRLAGGLDRAAGGPPGPAPDAAVRPANDIVERGSRLIVAYGKARGAVRAAWTVGRMGLPSRCVMARRLRGGSRPEGPVGHVWLVRTA